MGRWRHPVQCASLYQSPTGNRVIDGHGKFHRNQHKQDTVVETLLFTLVACKPDETVGLSMKGKSQFCLSPQRIDSTRCKSTPSTRGWWISVYYINKGGILFILKIEWPSILFSFFCYMGIILYQLYSFLQWGHRNRIMECPDLERTYRDHLVLPLTLHRTTPRIPPCA